MRLIVTIRDTGVFFVSRELQTINQQNKLALWAGRISECRSSGQNVKDWCKENGICEQTVNVKSSGIFQNPMSTKSKNCKIIKTFETIFLTTNQYGTQCSKPHPMPLPAPGEVLLVYFVLLIHISRHQDFAFGGEEIMRYGLKVVRKYEFLLRKGIQLKCTKNTILVWVFNQFLLKVIDNIWLK